MSTITAEMPLTKKVDILIRESALRDEVPYSEREQAYLRELCRRDGDDTLTSIDRVLLNMIKAMDGNRRTEPQHPDRLEVFRTLGIGKEEYEHIKDVKDVVQAQDWQAFTDYARNIKVRIGAGRNCTIHGLPGSGKSNILSCLLAYDVVNLPLETWQHQLWFLRGYEFSGYEPSIYSRLHGVRLLIIDNLVDVGFRNPHIVGIVNQRTNNQLSTFITTALHEKAVNDCFPGLQSLMRSGVILRTQAKVDFRIKNGAR